jgi:pimeloyl-ACP methyl ester carboxylesterase
MTWQLVHAPVAQLTQAVVYDRLGLGWSDPGLPPRTGEVLVAELYEALSLLGIKAPYVLVGHSFSGLLVRLFAFHHPREVAGMVLLDPAHEDQYQRFPQPIQEAFAPIKEMTVNMYTQVAQTILEKGPEAVPPLLSIPASYPTQQAEIYRWQSTADISRIETMKEELLALEETQAQVRRARGAGLGDLPLIVISHGIPQPAPGMSDEVNRQYEASWQEMQAEIASLSARGRRIVAEKSGHMIHHDQPELVVEAVAEVLRMAR